MSIAWIFKEFPANVLIIMFFVGVAGGILAMVAGIWNGKASKFIGLAVVSIELYLLADIFWKALEKAVGPLL